jgi:hypothetical protein
VDLSATGTASDDFGTDARLAELAVPLADRAPLVDRVLGLWQELSSTPRRAALCTIWVVALVVAAVSLQTTTVAVRTSLGPARAHCGLDIFMYGYPDTSVTRSCRSAEAGHLGQFVPAALVVVGGLAAAAVLSARRSRRSEGAMLADALARLGRARYRATLIVLGGLAVPAGILALRPVPVDLVQSGGIATAHCGADSYFFGYPDPRIDQVCHRAYAGHARVLQATAALSLLGLVALAHLLLTSARGPSARLRLLLGASLFLVALDAIVTLHPVTLQVNEGATSVYASCGLDSYLVGYPDQAVQSACRSHFGTHAAPGLAATALAIAALVAVDASGALGVAIKELRRSSRSDAAKVPS